MSSEAEDISFSVPEFDPELLEEYRKEFDRIDTDKNSYLDKKEFKQYLLEQGYSKKMVKVTYQIVDCNHDNKISFEEFASFVQASVKIISENDVNEYLQLVFNSCDKNKDGKLDKKEFTKFMKFMNIPVGFFQKDKKFKKVDTDNSGTIEFPEILQFYNFEMSNQDKKKKKK